MNRSQTASAPKFGALIAAAVIFANPLLNIIDILPDFFGCLFLSRGLERVSDLCPHMDSAREKVQRLRWILLAKLVAILLIPALHDDIFVLLATFAFAIVELLYIIPIIGDLSSGLEYLGLRYHGEAIYRGLKNLRSMTYLFVIARAVLTVIPELISLPISDYAHVGYVTSGYQYPLETIKLVLLVFGLAVSLILAVVWLCQLIPYLRRIAKDTAFLSEVQSAHRQKLEDNPGIVVARQLKTALAFIIAGFLFLPDLMIDGVNILPTMAALAFFFAALLLLQKRDGLTARPAQILCLAAFLSASVAYPFSLIFQRKYGISAVARRFEAYDALVRSQIFSILSEILLAAFILFLFGALRKLARKHLSSPRYITDQTVVSISKAHEREIERPLAAAQFSYLAVLALRILFTLLYAPEFPAAWLLASAASLLWVFYAVTAIFHLSDRIEQKYL